VKLILNDLHLKPLHREYQCQTGYKAFGVIDHYFFKDETGHVVTLTPDSYVRMVNEFLFPELHCCDSDLATIWFQQDGLIAYTAHQSMNN
jgi:hypothetical protein